MRNFPCSLVILVLLTQASDAKPLTYVLPEETATLRPGPGVETARDICASCHSVDYINTQPPRTRKRVLGSRGQEDDQILPRAHKRGGRENDRRLFGQDILAASRH